MAVWAKKFKVFVIIVGFKSVDMMNMQNLGPFVEAACGTAGGTLLSKFAARSPKILARTLFAFGGISAFIGAEFCPSESRKTCPIFLPAFSAGNWKLPPSKIYPLAGIGAKARLFCHAIGESIFPLTHLAFEFNAIALRS